MERFATTLIWLVAITAIALAIGTIFWPQFMKYEELKRSEKSLELRIDSEQVKNTKLRQEEHSMRTDPDYVEKVAREKLGLVKPGEMIYKFEEDKAE